MGQVLRRLQEVGIRPQDFLGFPINDFTRWDDREPTSQQPERASIPPVALSTGFPDLANLPPELGLEVLSHLNATDLCLASCVWSHLANDELLWQSLCRSCWGSVSAYRHGRQGQFSYKQLFMLLDEACLTFNTDPFAGIEYLTSKAILDDLVVVVVVVVVVIVLVVVVVVVVVVVALATVAVVVVIASVAVVVGGGAVVVVVAY
ncbi:F-box only protein 8 [Elysia marginata]|uniref:F-box only protein 8 n=1 Tax=Elysia marginata TaxID=1093978 RepID=A0AAV4JJE6_9GAST|nr:F-box only protein 8 [Elysia marginata]